jgi:hypothetical protein
MEQIKRPSKSQITRDGIAAGLTNEQVVDAINEVYPGEGKLNCVRWYRHQDPQITGRTRATSVKKAEIHAAFKEALNLMDEVKRSEILLGLVEKNIDTFVLKIDVTELKSYIPAEFLPVEKVKEPKAPKEPKAKKGKKAEAVADAGTEAPVTPEVAPEVAEV